MADKTKTYSVKQFISKLGKVKAKFTEDVAAAENWANLPSGTYNVQISKMVCLETKNGHPMFRIPYRVLDGQYAGRKGSVNAIIDPANCVKEGKTAGTPWGLVNISKIAKSIGVATMDEDGMARDLDDVLIEMEDVTSAEPSAVLVVKESKYPEKKNGKPTGVMKTAVDEFFSGLLVTDEEEDSDDEGGDEPEEEEEGSDDEPEEEEDEEEEEEETAEPAFNVGESVKYKEGRKILKGVVRKINDDGTYNVMGQDKKLKRNIPEDELSAA